MSVTNIFVVVALLFVVWFFWDYASKQTDIVEIAQQKIMSVVNHFSPKTEPVEAKKEPLDDYEFNLERIIEISDQLTGQINQLRKAKDKVEPRLKEFHIAYLQYERKGKTKDAKFFKEREEQLRLFKQKAENSIKKAMKVSDSLDRELRRIQTDKRVKVDEDLLVRAEATIEFVKQSNMEKEELNLNELKDK